MAIYDDLRDKAPFFLSIMASATKTREITHVPSLDSPTLAYATTKQLGCHSVTKIPVNSWATSFLLSSPEL